MLFIKLFFEFAKVGLFAVGGGLATIPFLQTMGERTGWFTNADLTTMIAVSESTPGPLGVNMASYVGFETGSQLGSHLSGLLGAAATTLGLITPSIIVILIIAGFLQRFRQSKTVDAVFYGLRPASTALITSAGLSVALSIFLAVGGVTEHTLAIRWPAVALSAAVFVCMRYTRLRKLHPIVFIAAAAIVGAVFQL